MQYSFSYMYFLMQEPKGFDFDEFWNGIDTDKDKYVVRSGALVRASRRPAKLEGPAGSFSWRRIGC